jgi:hypothetical protein
MCHTLWHRLDLDFVFDNRTPGACQPTQVVDACRFILERWAEPADLLVAKVSSARYKVDAQRESTD